MEIHPIMQELDLFIKIQHLLMILIGSGPGAKTGTSQTVGGLEMVDDN